jgi:hypothetical protein
MSTGPEPLDSRRHRGLVGHVEGRRDGTTDRGCNLLGPLARPAVAHHARARLREGLREREPEPPLSTPVTSAVRPDRSKSALTQG